MIPSPDMMQTCAPNVSPVTIAAIIRVESGGNPFALGVNGPIRRLSKPRSAADAARQARYYIGLGYSVDLGLMQINSRNLLSLGETVESILDPCRNLRAGSAILRRSYAGAARRYGEGQNALKAALSTYNTGNDKQGFRNGYVAKYYLRPNIRLVVHVTNPPKDFNGAKNLPLKRKPDIYSADSTIYSLLEEETRQQVLFQAIE